MKVEIACQIASVLGEGPVWDARSQRLFWLDVFRPSINRFDPATGRNEAVTLGEPIYAMALRENGDAVASLEDGFGFVSLADGSVEIITDPKAGAPVNFNDGKCDRRGRFWSGTMAKDWQSAIGGLYRLDTDLQARCMDTGIILSNGLGWSPDDRIMYFTDFGRSTIYAYDFDVETGAVSDRRPIITVAPEWGSPDGMTVDSEGCLWVAMWDGWRVVRYTPAGDVEREIAMPVQRPTSCMFGGPDLTTLFVTSATMQLSPEEIARGKLAGSLFAVETGIRGLPEARFAG